MNDWAANHPEEYAEIAALPLSQQNAALRAAIGYDPDAIRDRLEEQNHCHRDLSTSRASSSRETPAGGGVGPQKPPVGTTCGCCGAGRDEKCAPECEANRG